MIVIDAEKAYTEKKELERFEDETMYSTFGACPNHPEIVFESLEPRMFSLTRRGEPAQPVMAWEKSRRFPKI